jgi:hypothetical protein
MIYPTGIHIYNNELIPKTGWKINLRSLPLSLLLGEPLVAFVVARDREESEIEEEQQMTGHCTLYLCVCIYKPSSLHPPHPVVLSCYSS